MIEPEPLQQIDRTYVRFRGRKLSYFGGCDYFRMASHPKVIAALKTGANRYGLNVAASRLTTGNHVLYWELERELRNFFGAENALVVSNGYVTNLIVAQALAGNFSHALIDEKAHPSLSDAARFLDCPILQFRHREPEDLVRTVNRCGRESKLILLTDGLFAHDGSAAPLAEYLGALPKDAWVLIDDAHAAGVLGKSGRGSLEQVGVGRRRIVQTVTLSKAFGAFGGAILASPALRRRILERSQLFVGSTPLPLPLAAAALQAIKILGKSQTFKRRLVQNTDFVRNALNRAGYELPQEPGPILALPHHQRSRASKLKAALLSAGIFPSFIRYPGGPDTGYFRFVISSEHTQQQLERLVQVLNQHLPLRAPLNTVA